MLIVYNNIIFFAVIHVTYYTEMPTSVDVKSGYLSFGPPLLPHQLAPPLVRNQLSLQISNSVYSGDECL